MRFFFSFQLVGLVRGAIFQLVQHVPVIMHSQNLPWFALLSLTRCAWGSFPVPASVPHHPYDVIQYGSWYQKGFQDFFLCLHLRLWNQWWKMARPSKQKRLLRPITTALRLAAPLAARVFSNFSSNKALYKIVPSRHFVPSVFHHKQTAFSSGHVASTTFWKKQHFKFPFKEHTTTTSCLDT